jgi:hypothetical protein
MPIPTLQIYKITVNLSTVFSEITVGDWWKTGISTPLPISPFEMSCCISTQLSSGSVSQLNDYGLGISLPTNLRMRKFNQDKRMLNRGENSYTSQNTE